MVNVKKFETIMDGKQLLEPSLDMVLLRSRQRKQNTGGLVSREDRRSNVETDLH